MDMRNYRVIGCATYLDRAGNVQRINVNRTVESPDEYTAPILMLAEIEVHKGADANYDPQARWEVGQSPIVEDETAKQETIKACGFTVGSEVLHKSGGSSKRGADARVGIVKRVWADSSFRVHLSVDWPAPRRINGDGWHRSDVLASAVISAATEEIERRRSLNRAVNERRGARVSPHTPARAAEEHK